MNNWIWYQVVATGFYTVVNFTDKYILEKQIKDYRGMAMYSAIVGFAAGTLLWIISGFPLLGFRDGILVILTGVFSIWAAAIYFQVMQQEAASKVIFLLQLTPVLTLVLAYLFLHEPITPKQLLGFVLVLIPSLAVSMEPSKRFSLSINKTFWLMAIVASLWSLGQIIFKFVSGSTSFVHLATYESWGWAIGGVSLFIGFRSVRNAFFVTSRKLSKFALAVVFGNELVFLASKLLTFLAIVVGPVALVSVLGGLNIFYGILYGWILTILAPKIFEEDISGRGMVKKIAWALVMFTGIWLIY